MLPPGFADDLARVIEPRDAAAAGEVLREAAALDEERLAGFLARLAARIRDDERRLTAPELRALLGN